jgi:hypothetical protein
VVAEVCRDATPTKALLYSEHIANREREGKKGEGKKERTRGESEEESEENSFGWESRTAAIFAQHKGTNDRW